MHNHEGRDFTCRICGESFPTAEELRFHQQLGHLK